MKRNSEMRSQFKKKNRRHGCPVNSPMSRSMSHGGHADTGFTWEATLAIHVPGGSDGSRPLPHAQTTLISFPNRLDRTARVSPNGRSRLVSQISMIERLPSRHVDPHEWPRLKDERYLNLLLANLQILATKSTGEKNE